MRLPFSLLFGPEDLDAIRRKAQTPWGAPLMDSLRKRAAELVEADGVSGYTPLPDGSDATSATEIERRRMRGKSIDQPADEVSWLAFVGLVDGSQECLAAAKARALHIAAADDWLVVGMLHLGRVASGLARAVDWGWEAYSTQEATGVLDALVACGIENGDPRAPVNTHRSRATDGQYAQRSLAEHLDYRSKDPFHAPGTSTNNWDVVIGSGLMLGSQVVERAVTQLGMSLGSTRDFRLTLDQERFDRWYRIARERFQNFASRCYSTAGQYNEGPDAYYSYGTINGLLGLEVARRLRGDDLYTTGLVDSPRWQRELYPWAIEDGAQDLSDAAFPGHPGPAVIARLAAESGSRWAQGFFFDLLEVCKGSLDAQTEVLSVVWADENLEAERYEDSEAGRASFSNFGPTGDVVWRTGRDKDSDIQWIFRCGKWNGAHTHMDRNSLVLSAFGERLLVDAGRMEAYAGPHNTYHKRTIGHNCVLVGGAGQLGYNHFPTHGRLLRSAAEETPSGCRATVVGDASQCYAHTARALRAVHLAPEGFAVVWDYIDAGAAAGVKEFSALWHVDNRDGKSLIEEAGQRAEYSDGTIVFARPRARLAIVPLVAPDAVERREGWIETQEGGSLYVEMKRSEGLFLNLLVPLNTEETFVCAAAETDGRPGVSFELRGRTHTLAHLEGRDGEAPGFILDGERFEFSAELAALPYGTPPE